MAKKMMLRARKASSTGAPGTSPPGINGCISNCGTSIINSDEASTEFRSIGYFEAFGANRSCLAMHASQIPGSYSHVHYAFVFANSTGFKRILSFGGWSFSTSADSAPIFRHGTIKQYNLDGVDFDWEYPGAPDLPGVISSPNDGANYLSFLKDIRAILPTGKSLSTAAPASFWYLKGFPIASMSKVLDYIVYMTYDLHGQWDYNSSFANPGCPSGNCLRSHVNLTETEYALSMITKAGVPTNKIAVGIAGYGRSFGMRLGHYDLRQRHLGGLHVSKDQGTKASRINKYAALNFGGSVEWAIDLVQAVESPEDVENSLDVTALEESFTAALELSEYDISEFEDYNLTILATALKGWDGCKRKYGFEPRQISSGWQQSWRIMNNLYKEAKAGINWNEASAIQYLGPPAMNLDSQAGITEMYKNLATIQPGWLVPSFLSWGIAVRCDDPGGLCPCGSGSDTIAYTNNKDPKYGIASINFCPRYFTLPRLGTVMRQANTKKHPAIWANLTNYSRNQGSVWIHELLHLDWVALARKYGSNPHPTDMKVTYAISKDKKIVLDAYGPLLAKGLARFKPFVDDIGTYTNRNADNLSMYALARYVQRALKNVYPHLPLAPRPPETVDPLYELSGYVTLYNNGTVELPADRTLVDEAQWSLSQGVCAKGDDIEDGVRPDAFASITHTAQVLRPSDFPADYLSSWSSWAGLTPTTTSASPTPTATWTIAIYSEPDCAGDYYSLEGYNIDSPDDECLVLRGGGIPTTSKTGTTCRCVLGGVCTAYDTDTCTDDGNADAYDPAQGCHNYSASNLDTKTWISLQCGAQPGIGNGELGRRPLQMVQPSVSRRREKEEDMMGKAPSFSNSHLA
ncbi:glycoside hydrolase family 18 protein [Trichoderma longibrachiatum]